MSYTGKNPTLNWLNLEPLAADPTSPNDGDVFYSDGTPRDEGLWLWTAGAWAQISTGATLSVLNNLTLTPQASDPGSPVNGMIFNSNGTPRAAGLWKYNGTSWEQFSNENRSESIIPKDSVTVRAATTTNGILASDFDNGSTVDGLTLVTNDLILIKNQTTASENGVYVVQATGAPVRHSSADTFSELNRYATYVLGEYVGGVNVGGTVNKNTQWFQTATLTSLSDSQTWATTPASYTFTVPHDTYSVDVQLTGGGGGGAPGNRAGLRGGGGGGGGQVLNAKVATTPGEVLTINIGKGGDSVFGSATLTIDGIAGSDSTISFATSGFTLTAQGGRGGLATTGSAGGAAGGVYDSGSSNTWGGGSGPGGSGTASGGGLGSPGIRSLFITATALGGNSSGGCGGGGGSAFTVGGVGGIGSGGIPTSGAHASSAGGSAAGGGGGGGKISGSSLPSGSGGRGGSGRCLITW